MRGWDMCVEGGVFFNHIYRMVQSTTNPRKCVLERPNVRTPLPAAAWLPLPRGEFDITSVAPLLSCFVDL